MTKQDLEDRVRELEQRIRLAILASDNDGGSASDAIQDMLAILDPNDDIWTDDET